MKTCHIPYENACRMGVHNLSIEMLSFSVVEKVFNLHFDEIDLVVVFKSLHVGKYLKEILSNMPLPQ